ncbi:MAG: sensor histidine kinase [Solirubrobacteraceae bacterium]|nr:sensor histidine kinase [Solirubrobacteraceae bacterium]
MFRPFASSPTDAQASLDSLASPAGARGPEDGPEVEASGRDPRRDPTITTPRSSRVSLFTQVFGVNTVIIISTVFTASVAARLDIHTPDGLKSFLIAIAAILITALVNGWLLRRRFGPLERLIHSLEDVDLERPIITSRPEKGEPLDVELLRNAVGRMLNRLDLERRRRAGAVLAAQESERARLARDLHDEVNQSLTGVMLRLSAIARDTDGETREALAEVRELTDQAMGELLRLSHDLRPSALDDLGLTAALETRLQSLRNDTSLQVESDIASDLSSLSSDQQTVLFRVAQEAISNVVQHAQATCVHVSLQHVGSGVLLRVVDDGCGIGNRRTPSDIGERQHAGLTGMRERALLVGGNLDLQSSSSGTSVELVL